MSSSNQIAQDATPPQHMNNLKLKHTEQRLPLPREAHFKDNLEKNSDHEP